MKVLVTGGAGFIGSNVVRYLEEKAVDTVIFDDFSHADYRNITGLKADVICGSVAAEDWHKKIPEVDAVIHEAAITDTILSDDAMMVKVNYAGFKNIFEHCCRRNIPLVYASSAGVYGKAEGKMTEKQEPRPHNTYAYSKYLCDCLMHKFIKTNPDFPVIGLRYFNVYGPGEAHKKKAASMIYQLYKQMADGRRPRIFKFGEQKRDFIYVKDIARITGECLQLNRPLISNVGTGQPRTFNEIIAILNKLLKKEFEPDYIDNPYEEVYQDYTEADTSVLKGILKSAAEYSLEAGMNDYFKNHLAP